MPPLLTTNVSNLKPSIVKIEPELEATIETSDENLSTATTLVIMNPYEAEALMRFTHPYLRMVYFPKQILLLIYQLDLNLLARTLL